MASIRNPIPAKVVRPGTQSIERSVAIMLALASRVPGGWWLPDLAAHCGLDPGTTRRILGCLVRERLAVHRPQEQRYALGPLLFELGLGLPQHGEMQRIGIAIMETMAVRQNVARFLCVRSGQDQVCAGIVSAMQHAYTLRVGARRPLAGSVAGIAILIGLPREEALHTFEQSLESHQRMGGKETNALKSIFRQALESGMAVSEGKLTSGWTTYALPVRNKLAAPVASLLVAAPTEQLTPKYAVTLRSALTDAVAEYEKAIVDLFGPNGAAATA